MKVRLVDDGNIGLRRKFVKECENVLVGRLRFVVFMIFVLSLGCFFFVLVIIVGFMFVVMILGNVLLVFLNLVMMVVEIVLVL